MAGTRQNNTMSEGLMQLLQAVAQLKAAPDADLQYLASIESQILERIRAPMKQAAAKLAQAGGVVPPQMQQRLQQRPQQPPRGVSPAAAMPPGDELRRLVASRGMR